MEDPAQAGGSRDRMRDESDTGDPRRDFVYSPLNNQAPSIRLIRILENLSSDGCIQCEVRHASTASTYVCLSYVWGEPEEGQWILLNDQRHWVRDNLGLFLQCARLVTNVQREWLWIDALSIDQDNNTERSHQVQQMGQIYRNAARVISWFGMDADIERYFCSVASYRLSSVCDESSLRNSVYWKRAWITQEFALARQSTFMAGNADIDSERTTFFNAGRDIAGIVANTSFKFMERIKEERWELKGKGLFFLLQKFHDKQCSNPRDRIFSLIALCNDFRNLKVDYDTPPHDLVFDILQSSEGSMCLCSASVLDRILVAEWTPRTTDHRDMAQTLPAYMRLFGSSRILTALGLRSNREKVWISMYLPRVCGRGVGSITFLVKSASTSNFNSSIDEITYSHDNLSNRQPAYGCIIHVSGERHDASRTICTITLCFEMFLEISRKGTPSGYECCNRVMKRFGSLDAEPKIALHQKQITMELSARITVSPLVSDHLPHTLEQSNSIGFVGTSFG